MSTYHKLYYQKNKNKYNKKKPEIYTNISNDTSFIMHTEEDLHLKIVQFMREYYPEIILMSFPIDKLPEENRLMNISNIVKNGYHKGTPDLIIPEMLIAIELKRPNKLFLTKVSDTQTTTLEKLLKSNWTCIVSNDYTELIVKLTTQLNKKT